MNDNIRSEFRTYAWNYFSLHANQRLTTFNFFLAFATLLIAGLWSAISQGHLNLWIAFVISVLIVVISIIFEKLDERNRMLIHNAERALRYLDDQMGLENDGNIPHVLKLIARDDYENMLDGQNNIKMKFWPSKNLLRCTRCFYYVFLVVKWIGVAMMFDVVFLLFSKHL